MPYCSESEFLGGGGVAGPLAEFGALFGDFGGGGRGGDDGGGGDDAGGDEVAERHGDGSFRVG